jgi:hypothetical protein
VITGLKAGVNESGRAKRARHENVLRTFVRILFLDASKAPDVYTDLILINTGF